MKDQKERNNENIKQAIITICIGAGVAFFSTLFQELANFLKAHSTEIVSGGVSAALYGIKNIRA